MKKEPINKKEEMKINDEFLNLFSSDDKKKKKIRQIRETIDITDSIKISSEKEDSIKIDNNKETNILEQIAGNNILDNINFSIEENEIKKIRKVLDIIDKLKKTV